ncbi:hypothetical protein [Falsihalocynthiibacter arcticus]|uniref:ABC transmembrane type-1 domain-containing protein n=1 Tax=Falsihalocynthiibacter arcticus TaxID=1579316 RepID=A0A126UZC0_9RHOB|nr:hypothetical protein [Falsihalocynthiibacter arcticus]AML51422.1 hypothetical protein RC74_09285 [Falsihalocynthiibacter arcticus]
MNLYSRGDKAFAYLNMALVLVFTLSTLYLSLYILAVSLSSWPAGQGTLTPVQMTFAAYERFLSERAFWVSYGHAFIYTFGGSHFSFLIIIGFAVNAFNITLLRKFFEALLASSGEAARLGSTKVFQGLWKVFIPLAKPAIATITLSCIVARWNGIFRAMILVRDEETSPVQANLRKIIVELQADNDFGAVLLTSAFSFEAVNAAVMVCSILMVLIVYPFIQKSFDKGVLVCGLRMK